MDWNISYPVGNHKSHSDLRRKLILSIIQSGASLNSQTGIQEPFAAIFGGLCCLQRESDAYRPDVLCYCLTTSESKIQFRSRRNGVTVKVTIRNALSPSRTNSQPMLVSTDLFQIASDSQIQEAFNSIAANREQKEAIRAWIVNQLWPLLDST